MGVPAEVPSAPFGAPCRHYFATIVHQADDVRSRWTADGQVPLTGHNRPYQLLSCPTVKVGACECDGAHTYTVFLPLCVMYKVKGGAV